MKRFRGAALRAFQTHFDKAPRPDTRAQRILGEVRGECPGRIRHRGVLLRRAPATVYHEHDEVRDRRRQATPAHKKPVLMATAADSVWSWDITKLHGPEKWTD
jgi:hypothetical protein